VSVLDSNSNWKQLQEITKEELDLVSNSWEDDTSGEISHYINELTNDDIRIYPKPNFSRSAALRCEYVKKPDELTSTAPTTDALDAQGNLEPFHQSLAYYVAFLCKTDEKSGNSKDFFGLWQTGILECKKALASRVEARRIMNIYEQGRHRPLRSRVNTSNPFMR
jgi:hypothetical protein